MNKFLFAVMTFIAVQVVEVATASATTHVVDDVTIKVFANTSTDYTADLVTSSGFPSPCTSGAYINRNDPQMYATALAAQLQSKEVGVIIQDAAASQSVEGISSLTCQIIELWME